MNKTDRDWNRNLYEH